MRSLSSSTKMIAAAGLLGLAAVTVSASAASARTFTRCDAAGYNCVRVHCDWGADNCWREPIYYNRDYDYNYDRGYYGGGYYGGYGDDEYGNRSWVCDGLFGGDCHWVYY